MAPRTITTPVTTLDQARIQDQREVIATLRASLATERAALRNLMDVLEDCGLLDHGLVDAPMLHILNRAANAGPKNGYAAAHKRIHLMRGPAHEQTCECGSQAVQWAYDHLCPNEVIGEAGMLYSNDVDHYLPMCLDCHRVFDAQHRRARRPRKEAK